MASIQLYAPTGGIVTVTSYQDALVKLYTQGYFTVIGSKDSNLQALAGGAAPYGAGDPTAIAGGLSIDVADKRYVLVTDFAKGVQHAVASIFVGQGTYNETTGRFTLTGTGAGGNASGGGGGATTGGGTTGSGSGSTGGTGTVTTPTVNSGKYQATYPTSY